MENNDRIIDEIKNYWDSVWKTYSPLYLHLEIDEQGIQDIAKDYQGYKTSYLKQYKIAKEIYERKKIRDSQI